MKPQIRGLSIVLIGEFNPTIYQPRWFSAFGLMTDEEADTAVVEVIHSDVTVFQLPWFRLLVERERFQVICLSEPYFERVVGMVSQTFKNLGHTPIKMLGINNEAHYKATSVEKLHALGHALAPKALWNEFFEKPGLQSLTIRQKTETDKQRGYTQVTVEPSARVRGGLYVAVNEHFDESQNLALGCEKIVALLDARWAESKDFAERIFARVTADL